MISWYLESVSGGCIGIHDMWTKSQAMMYHRLRLNLSPLWVVKYQRIG